eukprot:gnl/TRDRNA2_/TRDRNA2_185816_c0_seq1.p1 gnl/TRDRNA2_/TRDRNA2_185816_c0~~gnl/TRDRNA2_/TRDRNA2_185816_c0_seq1.p1  ORF type:complete len:356 (+),score=61.89 gnl/TRDRNA2_/TRDRNA2_185816_c0_seq1:103-1170(+)
MKREQRRKISPSLICQLLLVVLLGVSCEASRLVQQHDGHRKEASSLRATRVAPRQEEGHYIDPWSAQSSFLEKVASLRPSSDVKTNVDSLPRATTRDIIQKLSNASFPERLGSCALVGSGSSLSGRGHGDQIDKHDTVIRVNRLPTRRFNKDFGKKTDVLFMNRWIEYKGSLTRIEMMGEKGEEGRQFCNHRTRSGCPFKSLVFSGGAAPHGWHVPEEQLVRKGWWRSAGNTTLPIGHQTDLISHVAYFFPALDGKVPSGGFKAFLTFAPVCDSLTMYGYSSKPHRAIAADGHGAWWRHNYKAEHQLMSKIANGELPDNQFEHLKANQKLFGEALWLKENLQRMVQTRGFTVVAQ